MEASWRKGSVRRLRHNRIYWLHVNSLESVIVGHICREDESYLNLQEASLYFSKPKLKLRGFYPPVLLKFAVEAHILADYPIVTFDR